MQCSRSGPHHKAALAGCQHGLPGVSSRGLALNQHCWLYRSPLPCIHCISTASGGLAARASAPRLSHSPYFQLTCLHNSAPSPGPSLQPPGGANDEFAVNFGEAVQVLRQDLPDLFVRDPRFHIFREDLTFRTPSLRYSTGLWKYRVLHRAARYLGNLLYADMQLNLTRMWQPAGSRQQLRVRWCVCARPRLSLSVGDAPQSTEVISTYTFDARGKIYEHVVDQIIPPESLPVRLLEWLVGRLQPSIAPQPQLPLPGLRDGMCSAGASSQTGRYMQSVWDPGAVAA